MTDFIIKKLQMNATKAIIQSESDWAFEFWNNVLTKLINKYGDKRENINYDKLH